MIESSNVALADPPALLPKRCMQLKVCATVSEESSSHSDLKKVLVIVVHACVCAHNTGTSPKEAGDIRYPWS